MTGLALNMGSGREQFLVQGEWVYQDFRSLNYKYPVPEADIAGFVKPFTMQVRRGLHAEMLRQGTPSHRLVLTMMMHQ